MRPAIRYHGGKWMLAPWIIQHLPQHRIYIEPYGGGASVLLRKPRAYAEIYNDLDGEIVNLFRVIRDWGQELGRLLKLTPYSRDEYRASFEICEDPLEQARRTVIRSFMGFGSNALCRDVKSGFRNNANRAGTTPAHDWVNYPGVLPHLTERFAGVVIENKDACELMIQLDDPTALHYCDPPYVHSTRSGKMHGFHGYSYEMTDDDHRRMAEVVKGLRGAVVISGYACDLYDRELFPDWIRTERPSLADGAKARTEVLWTNRSLSQQVFNFGRTRP